MARVIYMAIVGFSLYGCGGCSGSMILDTQIGGNLTIKEVFNDKKTT